MYVFAVVGLVVFHACWVWQSQPRGLWLPGLGVGIALVSWLGWRILPLLLADFVLVGWFWGLHDSDASLATALMGHGAVIGLAWWLYHHVGHGSRWLDDPRSATLFLILIPGGLCTAASFVQAGAIWLTAESPGRLELLAAELWLRQIVGVVATAPVLIVTVTPFLLRQGLIVGELPGATDVARDGSKFGERIELIGLTTAVVGLSLLHFWTVYHSNSASWALWTSGLILLVWVCIRQGLFGGMFAAGVTALVIVCVYQFLSLPNETRGRLQSELQGQLLAYCSTAMLVGVSASWIRANETRFIQVVGRIPFVVYSVRLPQGIPTLFDATRDASGRQRDSKSDMRHGPAISKLANVVLVSPACEQVLGVKPEALLGPYAIWMDQILPEDHVVVIAALAQLCLQKEPVRCEYRLRRESQALNALATALPIHHQQSPSPVWVRDTLTPHYDEAGMIDGWEGLVEDITEQLALAQNLRKMSTMLQVLVSNLPTGVYFVQGPQGTPILVNARARALLGQREDLSAGISHLSSIYRLHKSDGSEYPWEELPVAKALQKGVTCRANDIVVHRSDGRKTPLLAWAAPVDLHGTGKHDAAVWVLEDWSAVQQAEAALRESETRLRAIIEAMAEGMILQDANGKIIDCNPAACAILGTAREALLGRVSFAPEHGCVRENGEALPVDQYPDRLALRGGQAVRESVIGMPTGTDPAIRWLLVSSLPLPDRARNGVAKTRVLSTFADITSQIQMRESLRQARDKYQNLVETLPVMVVQRDRDFNITFVNKFAESVTGYSVPEMMKPGFDRDIIDPSDLPDYLAAADIVRTGQSVRKELRLRARDGSNRTVLAFIHPIFEADAVVGSMSVVLDLSVQRRLEKELQKAQQLELVGRLASGTVHDFNNLLAVIVGMAGLAKTEFPADPTGQQYLTRIEEVGEQASHLAGQLLAFSKERPKRIHPVDLNSVILQTVKLARSVIPPEIKLSHRLADALPKIQAEENQLKQILLNFCLNARDAMKAVGGTLTISTDLASPPGEAKTNPWVHFAIEDTGHGMDESVRSRIFEPFFSTKAHGTGLGLAVVQQIIQDLGGKIEVTSQPGVGTRFDIWLVKAGTK